MSSPYTWWITAVIGLVSLVAAAQAETLSGELQQWHPLTLSFEGPAVGEDDWPSPFRDYRLTVTFTHAATGATHEVMGHFAADGDAAETSAVAGSVWRCYFAPPRTGTWTYAVEFVTGSNVAFAYDASTWQRVAGVGTPIAFHGATGTFDVAASDKAAPDFRARGLLEHTGERYLRFAGTGDRFLKFGADSPENFLGYYEFDGTVDSGGLENDLDGPPHADGLHHYDPHLGDWRAGEPTWQGGKGMRIIGAIDYLASEGVNALYLLTMNAYGDGREVHPWCTYPAQKDEELRDVSRFDVSRLDQWEIVFRHMTARGVMLHLITQETENDQFLDGGGLGPARVLYYRELISRFAHHPALVWNLGEENTNTTAARLQFATFFEANDPYGHPVVVHTFPADQDEVYDPLLGSPLFDGPSLQGAAESAYDRARTWVEASAAAGRPWFVCQDEIAPASIGVSPDGAGNNHAEVRAQVLFGNLMAGGAGVESYFGYANPHNDMDCEDFRSRDRWWDANRVAAKLFSTIPFWRMVPQDAAPVDAAWVFAEDPEHPEVTTPRHAIVFYRSASQTGSIDPVALGLTGPVQLNWFNPRAGAFEGDPDVTEGGAPFAPAAPPCAPHLDWALVLTTEDALDCDADGVADADQIIADAALDADGDGRLDACAVQADCNANGVADGCDIADGSDDDCNANGVPDSCEEEGLPGLLAEYWNTGTTIGSPPFPSGPPIVRRIEPMLNATWGAGAPHPAIDADGFASRWSGYLFTPELGGEYLFMSNTNDGVRLWVGGQLVIDRWQDQVAQHVGVLRLAPHTAYPLVMEHYEGVNSAAAQLRWIPPGGTDEIIPADRLRSGLRDCDCNAIADLLEIDADATLDEDGGGELDRCECAADLDGDGEIGFGDLTVVLGQFGQPPAPAGGDANLDGVVSFLDIVTVLGMWGQTCPA